MAWRVRSGALPCFRVFRDTVFADVLSRFDDIEKRADDIADAEYQRLGSRPATDDFDGDMSQDAEWAQERGLAFYETMIGLRQATINLWTAGLFHLLEQQLAQLCWDSAFRVEEPKDTNLHVVADWYKRHFAIDLKQFREWKTIDELRLVANTVKHAEGRSAAELRQRNVALFRDPRLAQVHTDTTMSRERLRLPLAGDDMFVTEDRFSEYAATVIDFVKAIASHFAEHAETGYPCG